MTEHTNTPALRFSEFRDEWNQNKLSDVVNVYDGTHQTPKYTNEGIKFLSVENIKTLNSNKYISKEDFIKEFKIHPEYGDILMTRIGDIGTPNIVNLKEPLAYYVSLALLKPININSYFLNSLILSPTVQNELWRKTLHIAFPKKINKNEIAKVLINYPTFNEQEKIGYFFSKLDRQIELEEKKLELLEQQKRGYMQKIFSQEIRFKDENGNDYPDWKEQKLEELGRFNSGVGFPEKYQGGNLGTPFFKVSDMNLPANKTLMNMANNYVTDQQINEKKWKVINDVPAVIFAKVGAAIMLNRKRIVIEPFLMDNNTMSYSFSTHWDTNFGNIFFQTLNLPKYAQVGALPSYNSKDIGIIAVNLPSLSEQKKIGSFFIKLDSFIEKQSAKVKRLKVRKKGFLQKMFV